MIEDFDKQMFKKCMPHFAKPTVVFDIGAHEGLYTKFVLETIPDAECYLFEPNVDIRNKFLLKHNCYRLAVCNSNGYKSFYVPPKANDELSSLYKREVFKETGFETKAVPCTSIDSFCLQEGVREIDFVKVDVEGAELLVVYGSKQMMQDKKIKFIQIEYGGTYKDAGIFFNEIIFASSLVNYNIYELVNDNLIKVTQENFIEDYRYTIFLLTYIKCS